MHLGAVLVWRLLHPHSPRHLGLSGAQLRLDGRGRALAALRRAGARVRVHAPGDGSPRAGEGGGARPRRRARRNAASPIALVALLLAAVLVPASADIVLFVEDASGARALLEKAATYAASLGASPLGSSLRERVGIDLLSEAADADWGLAPGPRMLVISRQGMGLSA